MNNEELIELFKNSKYHEFITELNEMNAVDTADLLECVDEEDLPKIFRMLKKDVAANIFAGKEDEFSKYGFMNIKKMNEN